jgi:hypothetical protein
MYAIYRFTHFPRTLLFEETTLFTQGNWVWLRNTVQAICRRLWMLNGQKLHMTFMHRQGYSLLRLSTAMVKFQRLMKSGGTPLSLISATHRLWPKGVSAMDADI